MKDGSIVVLTIAAIALVGASITAWIYFGNDGYNTAYRQGTERISECVAAGGTWIELAGDCLSK